MMKQSGISPSANKQDKDKQDKDKQDKELNIVKKTCKELGLTYRQLGEIIGYSGDSLNSIATRSGANISSSMIRAIEMYLEILDLKKQLQDYTELKRAIKKAII